MNDAQLKMRVLSALESIASELEQLRMLREHELGVRVVHNPDQNIVRVETGEE
jgi:hypothetical protein